MNVKEELLDILCEYVDVSAEEVNLDESLKFASGLNSFVFLSMISSIEEHFSISIPNEKLLEFKTLNDIIAYIEKAKA